MSKIIIIADDLTGANANGSLLATKGFTAATCLDKENWNREYFAEFDAVSFNTDSRLAPVDRAKKDVYDAMRLLVSEVKPQVMSKRIDSTLRGNVGTEIDAALAAIDAESYIYGCTEPTIAIVVPSFPSSGRIAVGGYLIVNGLPLECSPIAKDPVTPITTSRFEMLIASQSTLQTGHIELATVLAGHEALFHAISSLKRAGKRIICCDAVTNEDIATIAKATAKISCPVLAADPGPFTAALSDVLVSKQARREHQDKVMLIVGSVTELVQNQMEALRLAKKCAISKVNCRQLVNPKEYDAALASAVAQVAAKAGTADVYGVCTVERPEDVISLEKLADEFSIPLHEASLRINTGLADIAKRLLEIQALHLGGLYTSGGEVTVAVSRKLQASGFSVRDEVLPLAVYGRLVGGAYDDLPMVTKGGFVGDVDSIVHCIDYLFTKISTRTRSYR